MELGLDFPADIPKASIEVIRQELSYKRLIYGRI